MRCLLELLAVVSAAAVCVHAANVESEFVNQSAVDGDFVFLVTRADNAFGADVVYPNGTVKRLVTDARDDDGGGQFIDATNLGIQVIKSIPDVAELYVLSYVLLLCECVDILRTT